MDIIIKILAFLFAIFILTLVHEFGHFFVARRCGVKVLKFSIGFGKALCTWRDRKNTEYVIAVIPLGGYVKMLDGRDMEVDPQEKDWAFDHKPVWQRFLVILAGPFANILLALIITWVTLMIGVMSAKPIIGEIVPNSVAYSAGLKANDEIIFLGNKAISDWGGATFSLFRYVGDQGKLAIKVRRQSLKASVPKDLQAQTPLAEIKVNLDLDRWKLDAWQPDPLRDLGIIPYEPVTQPLIEYVGKSSPAAQGGLQANDRIISIDGQAFGDWKRVVAYIQEHPQQKLTFTVERTEPRVVAESRTNLVNLEIKTSWKYDVAWKKIGYIGARPYGAKWPQERLFKRAHSPLAAAKAAVFDMYDFMLFNFVALEKLVSGKLSIHVLGGPITIFQSSSAAIQHGIVVYFEFLALFSLMLAFVNLLPIPGLDGCYLLWLAIEAIIRRPLATAVQIMIIRIGMVLLVLIMMQAVINDLVRLFGLR